MKLIICIGHILYLEKNLYCNGFLNISAESFYFYFLFHKIISNIQFHFEFEIIISIIKQFNQFFKYPVFPFFHGLYTYFRAILGFTLFKIIF